VGQDDLPATLAREMIGPDRILGLSTHTPEQVDAAGHAPVDYIGVGPVYETPTKPGRTPVGLELVRYARDHAEMPFFAIGGVDTVTVAAVAAAGGIRVAVVRALIRACDPERTARELRRALRETVGSAHA
jgi:thiamine-phosphate pyrophosphorylase